MPAGISRDRIEARAYEIWVEEGRPHGKHDEHWAKAAAELGAPDSKTTGAKTTRKKAAPATNGHDTAAAAPLNAPRKAAAPKTPKAPAAKTAAPKASEDPTPADKAPVTKAKRPSSRAKA